MSGNHLNARLLRTFLGELEEQLRAMNAELLALEATPQDSERLRSVFRIAHTLKGAARAAGVPLIEQACHRLETLLADARQGKTRLTGVHFRWLFAAADALRDAGERLKRGDSLSTSPLASLAPTPAEGETEEAREVTPAVTPGPAALQAGDGQVRIESAKVDALLAAASELPSIRGRCLLRVGEVEALHELAARSAIQWRQAGRRLRLALERAGAGGASEALSTMDDALEQLSRRLEGLARAVREDAQELTKVTDDVQHRARQLRMRPFAEACEALPRTVRDLAQSAGKQVELRVTGGEVEADRSVLDGLRDVLLQLVRNAVDHGVEPPAVRARSGKPPRGVVEITARLQGDRILVTVRDDGGGLDLPAIRAALARQGRPVPESDRDVIKALFESGISTRPEAGTISGRGVGLDIVREAVQRIRGTVDVTWEPGRGTQFVIQCPPSLVSVRVLLAALGSQVVAVPTSHIERLLRLPSSELHSIEGQQVISGTEVPVRLVPLSALLGAPDGRPAPEPLPVVLLKAGSRRLALAVDELLAEEEVVLRPLRIRGGAGPLISGGALLPSGRVCLVLNPDAVISAGLGAPAEVRIPPAEGGAALPSRRRILVVDDSITTRTLEQSILEAAGYEVMTAVDGSEAWRLLQERGCDLVVADVEMPRMDGFELCRAIRGSKRFSQLPVILVTAMETPEHRARGLEVGADAYLGKSSFDQQHLLDTIQQLLG